MPTPSVHCPAVTPAPRPGRFVRFGRALAALAALPVVPVLILVLILALAAPLSAEVPSPPKARPGGGKWRLGCMQGGQYPYYAFALRGLVAGLVQTGWMQAPGPDFPATTESTAELWAWLAANSQSTYISFAADAFWDAKWEAETQPKVKAAVLTRLNQTQDLDAVLALGTWAGLALATTAHRTPVFVFQTSDPVAAGIVTGVRRSGLDHVFVHTDPERHKRQLRLFHDLVGFKHLGIAYDDTVVGRAYAAVADAEAVAAERGFTLERCQAARNDDVQKVLAAYLACSQDLAQRVDAMYLTHTWALSPETTPELIAPFLERRIPTFAQGGARFVQKGVLLSMAQSDFTALGLFYAQSLGRFMNGVRPGDLDQVFEDIPHIAINIRTAKRVGFSPPLDLLSAAEDIYDQDAP